MENKKAKATLSVIRSLVGIGIIVLAICSIRAGLAPRIIPDVNLVKFCTTLWIMILYALGAVLLAIGTYLIVPIMLENINLIIMYRIIDDDEILSSAEERIGFLKDIFLW